METQFDLDHWESIKWKLKGLYPQLTNADLIWRHETKDDLFGMIATKLLIPKKEFSQIVDLLLTSTVLSY